MLLIFTLGLSDKCTNYKCILKEYLRFTLMFLVGLYFHEIRTNELALENKGFLQHRGGYSC